MKFHLDGEIRKRFEDSHLLLIPKDDDFWPDQIEYAREQGFDFNERQLTELLEVKEKLLQIVPEKFHRYIEDGSINLPGFPKRIAKKYWAWQDEIEEQFIQMQVAAGENTQNVIPKLLPNAQIIFERTLHDARIESTSWEGEDYHVLLNCSGGFLPESYVLMKFIDASVVSGEIPNNAYYIYDECIATENGIALKVLFDGHSNEVVIAAKTIDAVSVFHPKSIHDYMETDDWETFVTSLNPNLLYFWIEEGLIKNVESFDFANGMITISNQTVSLKDLPARDVYKQLHCNKYEDPYALFSEAVATEDLIAYVHSGDLEKSIRAWNTMYEKPFELVDIINELLLHYPNVDDNEMPLSIYVRHFYKEGILSSEVMKKYHHLFN